MINVIEWIPLDDTTKRVESFANKEEFFTSRSIHPENQKQQEMIDAMFNGVIYIARRPGGKVIYHRTLSELIREYKGLK